MVLCMVWYASSRLRRVLVVVFRHRSVFTQVRAAAGEGCRVVESCYSSERLQPHDAKDQIRRKKT